MPKRTPPIVQMSTGAGAGQSAHGLPDAATSPAPGSGEGAVASPERDEIARRAYEIYCGRGCADGRDFDDRKPRTGGG